MTPVKQRLKAHFNAAVEHFGEDRVFGVFHYGSFNYGLATAASDVDTKCILLPTFEDMCRQEQWTSVELHVDEEHCECKDIRKMVQMWQKMNMNFLEILFTDNYYINPKYLRHNGVMEYWHQILSYNDNMAYYDVNKAFMSVIGQTKGTARANEITAKKVMTVARLVMVLEKLNRNVPYEQIVRYSVSEQEALLKLKTEYEKENQEIRRRAVVDYMVLMEEYYDMWIKKHKNTPPSNIYEDKIYGLVERMIFGAQHIFY